MTISAAGLVGSPVRWRGLKVGSVVEVFLDAELGRSIGLEVRCGDGRHRFLPLSACALGDGSVELAAPLALSEPEALGFYTERGRALGALVREGRVRRDGGAPSDVLLDADGAVVALVEEGGSRDASVGDGE